MSLSPGSGARRTAPRRGALSRACVRRPGLAAGAAAVVLLSSASAGQEIDLMDNLSAPDSAEVGEDFAHRFTVSNIGDATPERVEMALQMTGTKPILYGGLRQSRTRFEDECEVVSDEAPVIVRCAFDGRYLRPGRKIWVELYARARAGPQAVRTRVLRYRYRERGNGEWTTPGPEGGSRAEAVTAVTPRP